MLIIDLMTRVSPLAGLDTPNKAVTSSEVLRAVADLVSLLEPRLLSLWQDVGMTLSQRRLLRRLRDEPRSAGHVAASLGISPSSLTRMLTRLEERGLIERTPDLVDRRRILVELTNAGRRTLEDHRIFAGGALAMAAESLSATQQRTAAESIGALVRLARELAVEEAVD